MPLAALLLLLAAPMTGGCWPVNDYERVDVRVIDGDTGRPVAGADVTANPGPWGAKSDIATADAAGRANVRATEGLGFGITSYTPGYLTGTTRFDRDPATGQVIVPIYRPPKPLAGVTVPAGFRGPFRVKLWESNDPQPEPLEPTPPWLDGKREFYTPADAGGLTRLTPPPELTHQPYDTQLYLARFADGTPLRYENPTAHTGSSGEFVYGLPDIRDLFPPRADGVALYHLGRRWDFGPPPTSRPDRFFTGRHESIYFVGTRDAASAEQRRLVAGAVELPRQRTEATGYAFKPEPLDIDPLPVGTELTPLF